MKTCSFLLSDAFSSRRLIFTSILQKNLLLLQARGEMVNARILSAHYF